uniref:uncharacterized protein n=1 Tax=Pristiophorus japonicus TaxID=55135 RepID=UPI00398F68F8
MAQMINIMLEIIGRTLIERLQQSFVTKDWLDDDKADKGRAHLLTSCGSKTYALMKDLLEPKRPASKSFEELTTLVRDHLNPASSRHMAIHRFYNYRCCVGQSIPDFVAELRRLASLCEFSDELRREVLRDFFFIEGIGHAGIFRKLIENKNLTLEAAVLVAQTFSAGEEETRLIYTVGTTTNETSEQEVHSVKQAATPTHRQRQESRPSTAGSGARSHQGPHERPFTPHQPTMRAINYKLREAEERSARRSSSFGNNGSSLCWRCGGRHSSRGCRFQHAVCRNCNYTGHLACMCRKMAARLVYESEGSESGPEDGGESTRDINVQRVNTISCHCSYNKTPPIMMRVLLNGISVNMGASQSLMSAQQFEQLWPHKSDRPKLTRVDTKLRTYTKEIIPVLGSTMLSVTHKGTMNRLPLWIVPGDLPALLGRSWLAKLNWKWDDVHAMSSEERTSCSTVLSRFEHLFQPGVGTFKGAKVKIDITQDARPVHHKARAVPYVMREKIEHELDRLLREGIISPMEFNDWASPIVPVMKPDRSV